MMQGVNDMLYQHIPFINELLLTVACIMFTGLLFINRAIWKL